MMNSGMVMRMSLIIEVCCLIIEFVPFINDDSEEFVLEP
jgi:hypothetical protein